MKAFKALSFALLMWAGSVGAPGAAKEVLKTETRLFVEQTAAREVSVVKGGRLLETALFPERLLILKQDAISVETGEVILTAGTQLIPQNILAGGTNYCTTRPARGNLLTGEVMLCFPDADGDLSFDEYFWTISALRSGVATGYFVPENKKKLRKVDAAEIPVADFKRNLSIRLEWVGGDGLRKPAEFEGVFCVDGQCDWRTRRFKAEGKGGSNTTTYLSFRITCSSVMASQAKCRISENSNRDYLAIDVRGVKSIDGRAF